MIYVIPLEDLIGPVRGVANIFTQLRISKDGKTWFFKTHSSLEQSMWCGYTFNCSLGGKPPNNNRA